MTNQRMVPSLKGYRFSNRLGNSSTRLGYAAPAPPIPGWWEAGGATGCVAAYQARAADSLADSRINLANPGTYDLTQIGSPTWNASDGWGGFTTSAYFQTGYEPTHTVTLLIQAANLSTSADRFLVGCMNTVVSSFCAIAKNTGGSNIGYLGSGQRVINTQNSGNLAVSGRTLTGFQVYYNGTPGTLQTMAWSAIGRTIYVGCRNLNGSPSSALTVGNILALAIYDQGAAMPEDQIAAVAAAMAAL